MIPGLVEHAISEGPRSFAELLDHVQRLVPEATATEIDAAARRYETGEPGAYLYRREAAQLSLL